jgi:benzoate-CoA ligase
MNPRSPTSTRRPSASTSPRTCWQPTPAAPPRLPSSTTSGTLSYGQLDERARRLAAGLRALGLKREERVLLLMLDGTDWPVAFLGRDVRRPGAGGREHAADRRRLRLHARAQPRAGGAGVGRAAAGADRRHGQSDHEVGKVIVSRPVAPLHPAEVEFEAFLAGAGTADPARRHRPRRPGFWLYSSGSTGRPKGTVHSHANPYWTASCTARACWACAKTMSASRPPSCSSPTAWATR